MLSKCLNGLPVLRIWVAVLRSDDHGPECPRVLNRWWKHRGRKAVSVLIAQRQEHGHDALDVRFQPNIPLEVGPGGRDVTASASSSGATIRSCSR